VINSRSTEDLLPFVREKAHLFIERCKDNGIDILITSTYRDAESQDALYAQGRSAPGKRVTNVAGGDSLHNWRVAFDFVPVENGKAVWNDDGLWDRCGAIAEFCGLEWGGRWTHFVDKPHCQDANGYNIAQYKAMRQNGLA
jgi:peptidoglycan LD-endopeptidase CwlK